MTVSNLASSDFQLGTKEGAKPVLVRDIASKPTYVGETGAGLLARFVFQEFCSPREPNWSRSNVLPTHSTRSVSLLVVTAAAEVDLCSLKSGVLELSQNVFTALEVVLGELQSAMKWNKVHHA